MHIGDFRTEEEAEEAEAWIKNEPAEWFAKGMAALSKRQGM